MVKPIAGCVLLFFITNALAEEVFIPGYKPSTTTTIEQKTTTTTTAPAATTPSVPNATNVPPTLIPGAATPPVGPSPPTTAVEVGTDAVAPAPPTTAVGVQAPAGPATPSSTSVPSVPVTTNPVTIPAQPSSTSVPPSSAPVITPGSSSAVPTTPTAPNATTTVTTTTTTPSASSAPASSAGPADSTDVITVKTSELTDEQIEQWRAFLSELRTCTTKTYTLMQINPTLKQQYGNDVMIEVQGFDQADRCFVTFRYYKNDDPRLASSFVPTATMKKYPTGQECQFTRGALQLYATAQVELLDGKEPQPDPILDKAVADQCFPFVMVGGEKNTVKQTLF